MEHLAITPRPPLQPHIICLYISYLQSLGLKYSTIRGYISAITFICKMSNNDDPAADSRVTKTLHGLRNLERSIKSANKLLPITKPRLHALLEAIPFCLATPYQRKLFKAIFLLSYYALLRVGEAVYASRKTHTVTISQLRKNQQDYKITLTSYKHSNAREDPVVTLSLEKTHDQHCPVE